MYAYAIHIKNLQIKSIVYILIKRKIIREVLICILVIIRLLLVAFIFSMISFLTKFDYLGISSLSIRQM